jgi:Zn-finger nucleic acid-binding protein
MTEMVSAKPLNCPICKIPAYQGIWGGQAVLHCAECNGLALQRAVMMKLQPHGEKVYEKSAAEKDHRKPPYFEPRQKPPFLICVHCGKRMKEHKLAGTAVDICEKCQCLWLDGPKTAKLNDLIGPYKWKMSA